jgi:hypothetical protein
MWKRYIIWQRGERDQAVVGKRCMGMNRRGKMIGMQGTGMDRRQGKVTGNIGRTRVC